MEALKKAGEYVNLGTVITTVLVVTNRGYVKFLGIFVFSSAWKIGTAVIIKRSALATLKEVGIFLVKIPHVLMSNTPQSWLATGAAGVIYYGGKLAYNMYIGRI